MSLRSLNLFFTMLLLATKKGEAQLKYSNITNDLETILGKLQGYRFIRGYRVDKERRGTIIFLARDGAANPIITNIQIVSKPSYRRTISFEKIKQFLRNYPTALAFARTSYGILSFQECEKKKCGGEWLVTLS